MGWKSLEQEKNRICEAFRKEMKTEEAHRLKAAIENLTEEITELGQSDGIDSYLTYFAEDTVSFLDYFEGEKRLYFWMSMSGWQRKDEWYSRNFLRVCSIA